LDTIVAATVTALVIHRPGY